MTANNKGFTIIEVVITIAIGAAVMALVLNAVAGARRSQRNNARASDVNKIAAGVNEYIAVRNQLPDKWDAIKDIVDESSLGHYESSSINPIRAWATTIPSPTQAGIFSVVSGIGGATNPHSCTEDGDSGTCLAADIGTGWVPKAGDLGCTVNTTSGETCKFVTITGNTPATPQATGVMGDGTSDDADYVVVFRQAGCAGTNAITVGGIREMAIAYKLEGQSDIICLEV